MRDVAHLILRLRDSSEEFSSPSNVGTISFLQENLRRTPILYRIAIGNAFVIALGAIGGTLIVSRLSNRSADWWLILLFLFIGTTLSVMINFWIIKNALRPLSDLSALVDQVQAGSSQIDPQFLKPTDPDITQLAATLDSLVRELNERNLGAARPIRAGDQCTGRRTPANRADPA